MRRKLFAFTIVAGMAMIASWAPRAEATGYCEAVCYAGVSSGTPCICSAGTDRPGRASTCGAWEGTSTRGCFLF